MVAYEGSWGKIELILYFITLGAHIVVVVTGITGLVTFFCDGDAKDILCCFLGCLICFGVLSAVSVIFTIMALNGANTCAFSLPGFFFSLFPLFWCVVGLLYDFY